MNGVDTVAKDFEGEIGVNTTDKMIPHTNRFGEVTYINNPNYEPPTKKITYPPKGGKPGKTVTVELTDEEILDTKWSP